MVKARLTLVASLCFTVFATQATTVIYQWVDKNNVAHYSQQPPQGVEFKEIVIKPSTTTSTTSRALASEVNDESSSLAKAFSQSTLAKCENARTNLNKLKKFPKIEATNSKGESRLLTDIEKLQQMKLSE